MWFVEARTLHVLSVLHGQIDCPYHRLWPESSWPSTGGQPFLHETPLLTELATRDGRLLDVGSLAGLGFSLDRFSAGVLFWPDSCCCFSEVDVAGSVLRAVRMHTLAHVSQLCLCVQPFVSALHCRGFQSNRRRCRCWAGLADET